MLAQEYPNLEYLVIDGGSSDGSIEIIRKYEKYLAFWISEADQGQGEAINKGLRRTTGEILCWLNSDDYYLPDTFRTVGRHLVQGTGTFALVGHSLGVYMDGTPAKVSKGEFTSRQGLLEFWLGYNMPQPSIFWRREVVDRVGLLDEDLYYTMDFDYWARIAEHFHFKNVDQVLSCATHHDMAKTADNYAGYYKELRKHCRRYWGSPLSTDYWRLGLSLLRHRVLPRAPFEERARQATSEILALVPEGATFILVDDNNLGLSDGIGGRRCLPFLERDGQYWGRPPDDESAIAEFERLRRSGVRFIVFAWPSFWWLKFYSALRRHLRARCRCILKNDRLVVFEAVSRPE